MPRNRGRSPPYRAAFEDNLRHVAAIAPRIDLAFIPTWGEEAHVVRVLRPRFTFPMHGRGREQAYAEFADPVDLAHAHPHLVLLRSFSKAHGLAALFSDRAPFASAG